MIRSHYGNGFIKQYVRDHFCLRTESATNDVTDYGVKKAVENLPELHEKLVAICDNYLTVQQDILETFVDRGQLRRLTQPTVLRSGKRIPGLKLDNARQLALMHALVRFAHIAAGSTFTTAEIHPHALAPLSQTLRTHLLPTYCRVASALQARLQTPAAKAHRAGPLVSKNPRRSREAPLCRRPQGRIGLFT